MTTWALDLDGVVWLGETAIEGSAEAISRLAAAGHEVVFCTNNSSETHAAYTEKLARLGVTVPVATERALVTSADAAASLIGTGERVHVCAGAGAAEAVVAAGGVPVDRGEPADVVLVGFHRTFDYDAMSAAVRAVLGGARLVATNDDPIYPAADGPAPGCGSILASIERGAGVAALVAGKPNAPMAALMRQRFGDDGVFVGDTLRTDGSMAAELGWRFGLVLSGNAGPADVPSDHDAAWTAPDLATLVDRHLGRTPGGM